MWAFRMRVSRAICSRSRTCAITSSACNRACLVFRRAARAGVSPTAPITRCNREAFIERSSRPIATADSAAWLALSAPTPSASGSTSSGCAFSCHSTGIGSDAGGAGSGAGSIEAVTNVRPPASWRCSRSMLDSAVPYESAVPPLDTCCSSPVSATMNEVDTAEA